MILLIFIIWFIQWLEAGGKRPTVMFQQECSREKLLE